MCVKYWPKPGTECLTHMIPIMHHLSRQGKNINYYQACFTTTGLYGVRPGFSFKCLHTVNLFNLFKLLYQSYHNPNLKIRFWVWMLECAIWQSKCQHGPIQLFANFKVEGNAFLQESLRPTIPGSLVVSPLLRLISFNIIM